MLNKNLQIVLGPLVFLLTKNIPLGLSGDAHLLLSIMAWILCWWIFSPIPLGITAIFGSALFAVFGVAPLNECFESFAHPLIFLFMGGFFLAKALEHHQLDKRFAYYVLTRRFFYNHPHRALLGIMLSVAFLSMWLSNTATTASFLPITLGIVSSLSIQKKALPSDLSIIFLLATAYSATIGGILTPIGSPPNLIAIGLLASQTSVRISFIQWMIYTAPVGILGLGILYLYLGQKLKHLEFNSAKRQFLQQQLKEFGALSTDQLKVLIIAITLFVFWLLPSIMPFLLGQDAGVTLFIKNHFSESSSAVLIASLLFIVPSSSGQRLLSWSKAKDIDWGTLLLFGGGLSLGKMIVSSGLGNELARLTHLGASGMSFPVFIFFVCAFAIFFTETSSNTAAANVLIPISLSLAITFGFNLTLTALGVALACNFAFMLPIATPPNAIVFGSKLVSLRSMAKMGFALNLFFLVFLTSYLVVLDQAL